MKATMFVLLVVVSLLSCYSLANGSRITILPAHALITPQSYHIGVTETFSLTSYSYETFTATASVRYKNCTCNEFGRRTCSRRYNNVYSQSTAEVRQGQPVVLPVEMPNIDELANRDYAVSVTAKNGAVKYLNEKLLNFRQDGNFGFLLIRTNKPIYKPDQDVSYCIAFLDKTLKPHRADATVEIIIKDSRWKQILKLNSIKVPAGDLKCLEFPLSEEPNFGTWRIEARVLLPNDCRRPHYYRYNLPVGSCSFKVEEFVLPKFEVTLTGPQQLGRDDSAITGLVEAQYTFGEPLQGTVKINATLNAFGILPMVFYNNTHTLNNGRFEFNISAETYHQLGDGQYDPFCVKSTVTIIAEVEEAGRGTKTAKTHQFSLVSSPVKVTFADDNPKVFRPGLNYTVKAIATLNDGSPALGTRVRMTATTNNGDQVLLYEEATTNDEDGTVNATFAVPMDTKCIKISLRPTSQSTSCTKEFECFSPSPIYSPTKSFLQLTDVSKHLLRPNSTAEIHADSTVEFQFLHLLVISQGSIQHHTHRVGQAGAKSTEFSFAITHSMTPRVKVLGYFAREDGELVADLIELEIQCDLENRMTLNFDQNDAKPGDSVSVATKAFPNSIILLSILDNSVTLLADACKSLDGDNVCALLRQLTRGSTFGGQSCSSVCCPTGCFKPKYNPPTILNRPDEKLFLDRFCDRFIVPLNFKGKSCCSEPESFGASDIFKAAGVSLFSNLHKPQPSAILDPIIFCPKPEPCWPWQNPCPWPQPVLPNDDIVRLLDQRVPLADTRLFFQPPDNGKKNNQPDIPEPKPEIRIEDNELVETEPTEEEEEQARTFFPESWIFQLMKADSNGDAVLNSTTPDTITTWFAESIGLHRDVGLGFSRRAQLRVVKDFFVSLELPFSVNFGEAVTIIPLVFNFGRSQAFVDATIDVQVDDDLDIIENSLSEIGILRIPQSSSEPFTLKLRPRAIGQLTITITAANNLGERDIVTKQLFVKPGCERFDLTENVIGEGTGEHCFNFTLPSCVVPGSASAIVSATGAILPIIETNYDPQSLLKLPGGCGEQNLVKTAINWVVGEYLVSTNQLKNHTAEKIKRNIQRGYQNQLNFLKPSGCFSIWRTSSCTSWLTAGVVNVFSGIVDFYREQEPDIELIDMSVINAGVDYIISNQDIRSGKIPVNGPVHNSRLMGKRVLGAHTAFSVVALKRYVDTFAESEDTATSGNVSRARNVLSNAESYLETIYNDQVNEFSSYSLALMSYSLFKSPTGRELRVNLPLLADLRSRITTSKRFAGTCFVCDDKRHYRYRRIRYDLEQTAACVETTGYALLALLEANNIQITTDDIECLAQWLLKTRKRNGGFYSSQDTIIGIQALTAYAKLASNLNTEVSFNIPELGAETVTLMYENRSEITIKEIPTVPSNNNCVSWSGEGKAIIQSTLSYHGCDCQDDTRTFSLELATERRDNPNQRSLLRLSVRIRYLAGDSSNMAIVDVEIPSGYIFLEAKLVEGPAGQSEFKKIDRRGSNAVFYFDDVPSQLATTFVVEFQKRFEVDNPQQSPVTIYDYYDPGQIVTKYYLPVTSEPLAQATPSPGT